VTPFGIRYHPRVRDDVARLPANLKRRIAEAVEARLSVDPRQYGHPLRGSLAGCWRLRVGDYRVVFRVEKAEVCVLAVLHRRDVYRESDGRQGWVP
jgi:mRNA interferase RelE/StbE